MDLDTTAKVAGLIATGVGLLGIPLGFFAAIMAFLAKRAVESVDSRLSHVERQLDEAGRFEEWARGQFSSHSALAGASEAGIREIRADLGGMRDAVQASLRGQEVSINASQRELREQLGELAAQIRVVVEQLRSVYDKAKSADDHTHKQQDNVDNIRLRLERSEATHEELRNRISAAESRLAQLDRRAPLS